MTTKMVFHGSDIEKICSYYNLKKENIVKFGANVNFSKVKNEILDLHGKDSWITDWSINLEGHPIKMLIFFLPIRTEIMCLSEIRSQNTAGFPLNLFYRATVPVN